MDMAPDQMIVDRLDQHMGRVLVENCRALRFQERKKTSKLVELELEDSVMLLEIVDSTGCC